ncbi:MAG: FMN reductase (NADPH) [Burkholderia plantarii]|nr:MAG: FMN reductase (NADPH) [Burkholderia plantarii]
MSKRYRIVAVSGNTQRPSRTLTLTDALPADVRRIELGALLPALAATTARAQAPAEVEAALVEIESADLLIVGSPVYRASYTGLFKHLFDLVRHDALIDVPVLLAATGGSDRHALVIEHQLRPLFSFSQTSTLPLGVYASEADFSDYAIASDALRARLALAIERALPWVAFTGASASSAAARAAA